MRRRLRGVLLRPRRNGAVFIWIVPPPCESLRPKWIRLRSPGCVPAAFRTDPAPGDVPCAVGYRRWRTPSLLLKSLRYATCSATTSGGASATCSYHAAILRRQQPVRPGRWQHRHPQLGRVVRRQLIGQGHVESEEGGTGLPGVGVQRQSGHAGTIPQPRSAVWPKTVLRCRCALRLNLETELTSARPAIEAIRRAGGGGAPLAGRTLMPAEVIGFRGHIFFTAVSATSGSTSPVRPGRIRRRSAAGAGPGPGSLGRRRGAAPGGRPAPDAGRERNAARGCSPNPGRCPLEYRSAEWRPQARQVLEQTAAPITRRPVRRKSRPDHSRLHPARKTAGRGRASSQQGVSALGASMRGNLACTHQIVRT